MAPVLKILGVPRLPPGGSLGGSPPGGSLGTGKRGTVPKIWRAVPIFFSACKWGLRHKTGLCCGIWRYCERSFPILTGGGGRVTSGRRSESLLITPNAFEPKYSNCSNELRSKLQSIAFKKSRTI